MHRFKYRRNELYCEETPVSKIAEAVGTPFYLYSLGTFLDHFLKLKQAFKPVDPLICFSVKSNSNLTILKTLVDEGAGLDVVSGGELFRAKKAGIDAKKIVYASVGKTASEIEEAVGMGILFFNVESLPELENINRIAKKLGRAARVAIRLNPDVEAKTHRFITTGKITNKFGIDFETEKKIFMAVRLILSSDLTVTYTFLAMQEELYIE